MKKNNQNRSKWPKLGQKWSNWEFSSIFGHFFKI